MEALVPLGAEPPSLGENRAQQRAREAAAPELAHRGPGPPGALNALSIFYSKSLFVWRYCMGAQGA